MPRLTIDLAKVGQNARLIAELLGPYGVQLAAVTKGCLGNELVAGAMLAGGAASLADSRAANLQNLRRHFPEARMTLMRSPVTGPDAGFDADIYFVSSLAQASMLAGLAGGRQLDVCLLLETGDGREGAPPKLAAEHAAGIDRLAGLSLVGFATNSACARAGQPADRVLMTFHETTAEIACRAPLMSVGGSGLLALLAGTGVDRTDTAEEAAASRLTGLFDHVTEMRCGESILLGRIPSGLGADAARGSNSDADIYLDGAHRDAFVLEGPVLEVFEKDGAVQALVGLGSQDAGGRLIPRTPGITCGSMTSDYLAVRWQSPVTEPPRGATQPLDTSPRPPRVGETIGFIPTYYALVSAMTSPFVRKEFLGA